MKKVVKASFGDKVNKVSVKEKQDKSVPKDGEKEK